jgi:hypothetical protein
MKRLAFIASSLLAVACICGVALAQSSSNTAQWTWGAVTTYADGTAIPSTVPVTYNLYIGTAGKGSEAATPAQSGLTSTSFATSGYSAGETVCGEFTAVAGGVEGARSNEACKTFPAVPAAGTLAVK